MDSSKICSSLEETRFAWKNGFLSLGVFEKTQQDHFFKDSADLASNASMRTKPFSSKNAFRISVLCALSRCFNRFVRAEKLEVSRRL